MQQFARFVCLCLLILTQTPLIAQYSSHKKKHSTNAGSFFFYWGYNRSAYTKTTLHLVGSDYDFKLKGLSASDRPDKFDPDVYLNIARITVPQYNLRAGYYYTDRWAISFGVDHLKYVIDDNNSALLSGFIQPGIDSTWSGEYSNFPVVTDRQKFHYENTNGLNFLRFELMRSFDIWETGRSRQFALTANAGLGTGPMLTFNDLTFGERHTIATPSISGYGFAFNGSIRAEFFKHFFLLGTVGTGFAHLTHVRTRPDDRNQYAKQFLGYIECNITAGALFYFRSKNGCDTCPSW